MRYNRQKQKIPRYDDLGPFFDNRRKEYRDKAKKPLFRNDEISYQNRKTILKCLPFYRDQQVPEANFGKVFSPFTTSADSLFLTGVSEGQWNQRYGPFTAIYLTLREYFRDFYSMVDGFVVEDREQFEEVREEFNKTWRRILEGKGSGGVEGTCSVPEMQRLGSLFYILQRASRVDEGIAIDNQKKYNGSWCGEKVVVDRNEKVLKQYQAKLRDVYFSDLSWKKFFMRFIPRTDEETLWYIKLPNVYDDFYSSRTEEVEEFEWFDIRDFGTLVDYLPSIDERDGKIFLYTEDDEGMFNALSEAFPNKMQITPNVYSVGDGYYLHRNLGKEHTKMIAITNYSLPNSMLD